MSTSLTWGLTKTSKLVRVWAALSVSLFKLPPATKIISLKVLRIPLLLFVILIRIYRIIFVNS